MGEHLQFLGCNAKYDRRSCGGFGGAQCLNVLSFTTNGRHALMYSNHEMRCFQMQLSNDATSDAFTSDLMLGGKYLMFWHEV